MPKATDQPNHPGPTPEHPRRKFLKTTAALLSASCLQPALSTAYGEKLDAYAGTLETQPLQLEINGKNYLLDVEPRTTLLDLLRENLHLTGTKKGCDWGQCGACTVHINGRRALSCLSLAVMQQGKSVTTIEGIAKGDTLHPLQEAFIEHDGFQCGYCTPGQIMSGIGCIKEGHANSPEEIREYMSGNICRCGAYNNITDAVQEVQKGGKLI